MSCSPSATPSNSTSFNCSVTFSESVTGFSSTTTDVTISGTSSNWTKGASSGSGAGPYTFTVSRGSPNTDGTLTIQVAANAAQDTATNNNTASNTVSYTIDTTAPTAALSCSPSATPSNSTSFNCSVTFSESVTGFDSTTSDVTISGTSSSWTKGASSGSGAGPYTFTVSRGSPNTDGTLTIQVAANAAQDTATNNNTASNTVSYTIDTTPPTAALSCLPSANPSNSTSFNCSVTFSESVTGFDSTTSDVTIGGTSSSWTKGASSGSGAGPYTFTVSRGAPNTDGSLTIQVAAGAAQDAATNGNTASNTVSYTIDTTPPTAALSCLPSANPSNSTSFNCSVTFSESVSGFDSTTSDVTIGGTSSSWTKGASSGSGAGPYTFTVSRGAPNTDGSLTIQIAAGAAQDAATNSSTASNTVSYTIDTTAPSVSSFNCSPSPGPTNSTSLSCSVTFSESVTGFSNSGVTTGGTSFNWAAGTVSGSGSGSYTFTVSRSAPDSDGTLTIQIAAGAAQDAAGNNSTASSTLSYTIDTVTNVSIAAWTDPVTFANQGNASASGTSEAGDTIDLTVSDGTVAHDVTASTSADGSGNWSFTGLDLSGLDDGPISYSVKATDAVGNTATDSQSANKDTVTNVSIAAWTHPINGVNQTSAGAAGTSEAGDSISLTIDDGSTTLGPYTTTADGSGNWSFSGKDVSSLADGTNNVTYSVTATDAVGNTASDSKTSSKDTVKPNSAISFPVDQTSYQSAAWNAGCTTPGICGTSSDNAGGLGVSVVKVSIYQASSNKYWDGSGFNNAAETYLAASTSDGWAHWHYDFSAPAEGNYTIHSQATDNAGNVETSIDVSHFNEVNPVVDNTGPVTSSTNVAPSPTNTPPTVTATATDALSNVTAAEYFIDDPSCTNGAGTAMSASDSSFDSQSEGVTATLSNTDFNALSQGSHTIYVHGQDSAGNWGACDSATFVKDTVTNVSIAAWTDPVTFANQGNASASGTSEAGDTIDLTVSDGTVAHDVTASTSADGSGNWSFTGLDLSGLDDGPISYSVKATDAVGNTATDSQSANKDTVTNVSIAAWTDPVTFANQGNASASGTSEAGDTIDLTVSDGTVAHDVTASTSADGSGNWSFTGLDLSGLDDGPISYSVKATDAVGNTATDSQSANKDTVTNVSIAAWTDPVTFANQGNASASGTSEAGDTIDLTVSDGTVAHDVTATTSADGSGNWSFTGLDLSGLDDGPISYSVKATDAVGNTATDSQSANKDTVTNVSIAAWTDPVTLANPGNASASGTSEAGDTIIDSRDGRSR